ncbi:MAG: PDZ domain-containing protein, partial [Chloroflexi bacterium]|nr:PDZ domain-containing protein [Chloroflexota bacterium]
MRKLIAGALIAMAFLALTGVIVSQSLPTQASDESSKPNASIAPLSAASVSSSDAPSTDTSPPRPQARALGVEAEKQPFIGVTIETLDEGEAAELGIAGGAVVRSVLEDGPSAGLLQVGDIITHIDDIEVTSVRDVVEAVKASETGDVLSFGVIRDGGSISVDVEVGEHEGRFGRFPKKAPFQGQILGQLQHLPDNFVKAELSWDTDDGVKTARGVAGTIANLNVEDGTFDLIPTDGSDTISYAINDDTKVISQNTGDLSGLNEEDRTLVVDVTMNGEAGIDLDNTVGTLSAAQFAADFITAAKIAPGAIAKGDQLTGLNDLSAAEVKSEANDALVVLHLDHLLAVDYDPASKPGTATALLNELIENNSGVSRYTAAALAQGPDSDTTTGLSLTADQSSVTIGTGTTNTDMRGTDSALTDKAGFSLSTAG